MPVYRESITLETNTDEFYDMTDLVQKIINKSEIKNGLCNIFVPGSTASVSTIEFEPNLIKDVKRALEEIAPSNQDYEHHKTWHDDNGRSHVKAALMKPEITVPLENGKLIHGTWQQLVLMEFDTRARQREIIVTVVGK